MVGPVPWEKLAAMTAALSAMMTMLWNFPVMAGK
jgi:hypothetical protein